MTLVRKHLGLKLLECLNELRKLILRDKNWFEVCDLPCREVAPQVCTAV
jgi:hypothetical protein